MARKRPLALVVVGTSLTAAITAAAFVVLHPRSLHIDQKHFGRIAAGMAKPEVEAILGGPPGDYTDRRSVSSPLYYYFWPNASLHGESYEGWVADGGGIVVVFDADHRVKQKWFRPAEGCISVERTMTERLQRLSERWFRISWP
jgi:hypothetical protein